MKIINDKDTYPITNEIILKRVEEHLFGNSEYLINGKSLKEREQQCIDTILKIPYDKSFEFPLVHLSSNICHRLGDGFVTMSLLTRFKKIFGKVFVDRTLTPNHIKWLSLYEGTNNIVQTNNRIKSFPISAYKTMILKTIDWKPNIKEKIIVTQLKTNGKFYKRISEYQQNYIRSNLEKMGYKTIELGLPYTAEECLKLAQNAIFFVGGESGVSHLLKSMEIPIHILTVKRSNLQTFQNDDAFRTFEPIIHESKWDNDKKEVVGYNFIEWLGDK